MTQTAKMVWELAEQQDLEDEIIAQKMQLSQLENLRDDDTPFADVADGVESLLAESVSHGEHRLSLLKRLSTMRYPIAKRWKAVLKA